MLKKPIRLVAALLTTIGIALAAAFVAANPAICSSCPTSSCNYHSDCGSNSKCYCSSTGSCVQ